MKRHIFCLVIGSLVVVGTIHSSVSGRGNGRSSQYAAGRSPVAPSTQGTVTAATVNSEYTYGSTSNDVVEMVLKVPSTAEVWFKAARPAAQAKAVRRFVTPALEPGQDYTYDIRVRWLEGERPI